MRMNPFTFQKPLRSPMRAVWIVLPFHPDLRTVRWAAIVREVSKKFEAIFHGFNQAIPDIRVCWRNSLPSVGKQFRRIFEV